VVDEPPDRSDIRARLDALDRLDAHVQRELRRRPRAWTWSLIWLAAVLLAVLVLSWLS
jgi:hypothetical protein